MTGGTYPLCELASRLQEPEGNGFERNLDVASLGNAQEARDLALETIQRYLEGRRTQRVLPAGNDHRSGDVKICGHFDESRVLLEGKLCDGLVLADEVELGRIDRRADEVMARELVAQRRDVRRFGEAQIEVRCRESQLDHRKAARGEMCE